MWIQIQDTYAAYKKLQKLAKSFQFVTLVSPDKLFVDGSHSLYKLFGEHPNPLLQIPLSIHRCAIRKGIE